MNWWNTY